MQVKASQKQTEGNTEGTGALLCVCLALLVGKDKLSHVTVCFAWLCFALFVGRELSHVTVCFVLRCFGFVSFSRTRGTLPHVTICFALCCFASLCIALLFFASHKQTKSISQNKQNQAKAD